MPDVRPDPDGAPDEGVLGRPVSAVGPGNPLSVEDFWSAVRAVYEDHGRFGRHPMTDEQWEAHRRRNERVAAAFEEALQKGQLRSPKPVSMKYADQNHISPEGLRT